LAAIFFLFSKGLHLSVEFTGGTLMEVNYPHVVNLEAAREAVQSLGLKDVQVQNFGSAQDILVRLPASKGASASRQNDQVFAALKSADSSAEMRRTEFVGPQVGDELAIDGLKALGFVVVGIMLYLAVRFEWKFSVAAIVANLHDVIIILGFFAFFQWEFSLPVLAAVLAVLGYSVNESVVIFDRIRENFRRYRKLTTVQVIDNAITSTMSRTIITHGCTQLMVLSMLLFGGPSLHYFALALTIGILFGIYSSVFVAAAIAMWLGIEREDLMKGSGPKGEDPEDPNSGAVV
jgi:preprotein translocase subunit SecF